jgi:hypothetical protein
MLTSIALLPAAGATTATANRAGRRRGSDERQRRHVGQAAADRDRPATGSHRRGASQRLRRHQRDRADEQHDPQAAVAEVVLALQVGQPRGEARKRCAVGGEERGDGRPRAAPGSSESRKVAPS